MTTCVIDLQHDYVERPALIERQAAYRITVPVLEGSEPMGLALYQPDQDQLRNRKYFHHAGRFYTHLPMESVKKQLVRDTYDRGHGGAVNARQRLIAFFWNTYFHNDQLYREIRQPVLGGRHPGTWNLYFNGAGLGLGQAQAELDGLPPEDRSAGLAVLAKYVIPDPGVFQHDYRSDTTLDGKFFRDRMGDRASSTEDIRTRTASEGIRPGQPVALPLDRSRPCEVEITHLSPLTSEDFRGQTQKVQEWLRANWPTATTTPRVVGEPGEDELFGM